MEIEKIIELTAGLMSIGKEGITENTEFVKDLGMDSLDVFQLAAEIEDAFGADISDEALKSIKTIKDAANALRGM